MKRWIAVLVMGLGGIASAYFASGAEARARPTFGESHIAVHMVLEDYADLTDGHLIVGPCRRAGDFSTICRARIDGPSATRYRLIITGTLARNYLVTVRTRH